MRALHFFSVEAFALRMQVLMADDRFTWARDLLKKNAERVQNIAQVRQLEEQLARSDCLYASPYTSLRVC